MRCNPWRWLWGLLPILIWSWVTTLGEKERIEADLNRRAQAELSKAGHEWASTRFDGRDGEIRGKASEDGQPTSASELARRVWGVRVVNSKADLIDKIDRYLWSATHRENRLKLTGFVPNQETRKAIIGFAKANFPKSEVVDQLKEARGVPERDAWLGGISFGLKQLASLKSGAVDLNGMDLSVAGEAVDFMAYRGVKGALNRPPSGVKLASDKVTPPVVNPYTWSAALSPSQLVLSGHVPSDKQREDVFAHAKKTFPKLAIVDRMETADGSPAGWLRAALVSIDQLAQLKEGGATMSGAQLSLTGEAADEAVAERVKAGWRKDVPNTFKLSDNIKFPKPVVQTISPYVTRIDAGAGAIDVAGHVPSDAARAALVEAVRARLPGRNVNDRLQIGAGAPEGWQTCVMAAVNGLGRLGGGVASLSDRRLEIVGQTDNEQLVDAIPGEVRAAANRACDPDVRITLLTMTEPSLNWRAAHDGAGQVVLEGEVTDAAAKASLLAAAAKMFAGARIVDRMTVVDKRSERWTRLAELGLGSMAKLRKGEAVIAADELLVRGEARDTGVVSAVKGNLARDVPKGYRQRDIIEVRSDAMIWAEQEAQKKAQAKQAAEEAEAARKREEAEAAKRAEAAQKQQKQEVAAVAARQREEADKCQTAMRSVASEGVIQFQRASFDLDPRSLPTLDRLAKVANQCPSAKIEIEGHTDAEGTPERNARLSQRRAEAVVGYLARVGVAADRLTAVGYGETRPVAPNDTAQNRAKNRRIEFSVRIN